MTWNALARPNGHCVATPTVWRSFFYNDEIPTFNLASVGTPFVTRYYEVYNLFGSLVTSGSIVGGQSVLTLANLPLGWYKLYFWRGTPTASPWLSSGGEVLFCVVRHNANLLARPTLSDTKSPRDDTFLNLDFPSQGFIGIGPFRHQIRLLNQSTDRTQIVANAPYERTKWATDTARPLVQMVAFPDDLGASPAPGDLTIITNSVVDMVNNAGVVNFECTNEPNTHISAPNFISQLNSFADTVHAAHASAKVMAPSSLNITNQLAWLDTVFASCANKIDIVSFHNYDAGYGLNSIRAAYDGFVTLLTKYGMQNKPRFNTEGISKFQPIYGSYEPMVQARMTMLEYAIAEQYGVPKEKTSFFYETSHGFWDFPSWWLNDGTEGNPGPTAALIRVWSEELWGKAYAAKLDFGTTWNTYMIGSRFDHPSNGTKVISVITDGINMDVKFQVTGATFLETVDYFGNVTTTAVVNGILTLPVTYLPKYIRMPAGVTCVPADVNGGRDVYSAQQSRATSSTRNATTYAQDAADANFLTTVFRANDSEGSNATWELAFTNPTRFDRIIVSCPFPWQEDSSLLDFDLQYWNGSSWVTLATITEPTNTFQWTSAQPAGACYVDTYWTRRNIWKVDLTNPITATKIRIFARSFSYGGGATLDNTNGAGLAGGSTGQTWPKKLCLREVAVYLKRDVGVGVGQGVNAVPGIGISL